MNTRAILTNIISFVSYKMHKKRRIKGGGVNKIVLSLLVVFLLCLNTVCKATDNLSNETVLSEKNTRYLLSDNQYIEMLSPGGWQTEYEFDPLLKEYTMIWFSNAGEKLSLRFMASIHNKGSELLRGTDAKMRRLNEKSANEAKERVGQENVELVRLEGEFCEGYGYKINAPEDDNEVAFTGTVQSENVFITFLATTSIETKNALEVAHQMILSIKFITG